MHRCLARGKATGALNPTGLLPAIFLTFNMGAQEGNSESLEGACNNFIKMQKILVYSDWSYLRLFQFKKQTPQTAHWRLRISTQRIPQSFSFQFQQEPKKISGQMKQKSSLLLNLSDGKNSLYFSLHGRCFKGYYMSLHRAGNSTLLCGLGDCWHRHRTTLLQNMQNVE